jgi:hypothetical protein
MTYNFVAENPHRQGPYVGNFQARYYHLFSVLMPNVCGHKTEGDRDIETIVARRLIKAETNCCQQGTEMRASRDDKCLNCGRDYEEKQWNSSTIKYELFLLEINVNNTKYVH